MSRAISVLARSLSLCAVLAACGGGSSDGGPDGGEGGAGDARGEDATPVPIDPTPILERTPRLEATCSVAQALDNVGTNIGGIELHADGATPTLAYVQGGFPASVEIAPLTTAPGFAIGTSTVTIDDQGANRLVASFPVGDLSVLAWLSYVGDENQLRLARVDGAGAFATMSGYAKIAHDYLAFPFMLGLVIMFLIWIKDNIPNSLDLQWIKKGGGMLKNGEHPPARRFNAGQKGIFWIVIVGGVLMSLSGWFLLFPYIPADVTALQFWTVIHAVIAMLFVAAMLAHIYIGSVGMEGAFDAMGTGEVDLNWAKEHHSLWVEEEQAKGHAPGRARAAPAE